MALTVEEKLEMVKLLEEKERRKTYGGHLAKYFPDEGPLRAELYPKHQRFFEDGAIHRERIFMAANRVGKTVAGAYELTAHLTGQYPDWWKGRRFTHPITAWAAGDTGQTTRDVVQVALLGTEHGTGMIAKDRLGRITGRPGYPDAVDTVMVKHVSGGWSDLGFKSFDQKRRSFQGTNKHVVWLDEECPQDVYSEAAVRTMNVNGIIYVTFTPLNGLTKFIQDYMKAAHEGDEDE
jgi:phage terminase large subunit-like protein